MNIHAIGWGMLASIVSILLLRATSITDLEKQLIWVISLLIGLAVTLITW